MQQFITFSMISFIKLISRLFYRFDANWLDNSPFKQWNEIKLIIFLNHTSLFEPIFLSQAPSSFIWRLSKHLVVPGADITLNRPIIGRFFKFIAPGMIAITRKRDSSWNRFMEKINEKSVVAILPEGRMKRKGGLDKQGKPMSVRGGIADILASLNEGKALFVYSGGLHHIQSPGQKFPKLFKRVKVNFEVMNIEHYKKLMSEKTASMREFRKNIVRDLNEKLITKIPRS